MDSGTGILVLSPLHLGPSVLADNANTLPAKHSTWKMGWSEWLSPPANAGDTGLIPLSGRFHMPQSNEAGVPQLLEPAPPRALLGKLESSPHSWQLEKAHTG